MKKAIAKLIKEYAKHTGKDTKKLKKTWNSIPWNEREKMKEQIETYNSRARAVLQHRRTAHL